MGTTTFPIVITSVSFPASAPGGLSRAWLELVDDADGHPLQLAVPIDFARTIVAGFPGETELTAQITIAVEDVEDAITPQVPPAPVPSGAALSELPADAVHALAGDEVLRSLGYWPVGWRNSAGDYVDACDDFQFEFTPDVGVSVVGLQVDDLREATRQRRHVAPESDVERAAGRMRRLVGAPTPTVQAPTVQDRPHPRRRSKEGTGT